MVHFSFTFQQMLSFVCDIGIELVDCCSEANLLLQLDNNNSIPENFHFFKFSFLGNSKVVQTDIPPLRNPLHFTIVCP